VPFSYFRYPVAFSCWLSANLIMLVLTLWLLRAELQRVQALWKWLPVALSVGFIPLSVALMQGQDSILLLLLTTLSFIAIEQRQEMLAGLVIGLAVFRFPITLPIAALFFLWRRWRFSLGFAFSALTCLLGSLAIAGIEGLKQYWELLRGMSSSLD